MSDATAEMLFAAALAAFQHELPSVRKGQTANTGTYSYSYADLTDITEVAAPLLAKNGLSWTAAPTITEHGFVLRYALLHDGGHSVGGEFPLPDPAKSNPQQIGSWLTYARRYALCAVTGIAPGGDDDDAAKAMDARSEPLPRAPRRRGATTRHNGPDDPTTHQDEWTVQTDTEWLEDARASLGRTGSVDEVRELWQATAAKVREGRLAHEDAEAFKAEMTQRQQELQGVPA
jgi:hypothetical protein